MTDKPCSHDLIHRRPPGGGWGCADCDETFIPQTEYDRIFGVAGEILWAFHARAIEATGTGLDVGPNDQALPHDCAVHGHMWVRVVNDQPTGVCSECDEKCQHPVHHAETGRCIECGHSPFLGAG